MTATRIVFMGAPEYSVPSLSALVDQGYEIVCVVTRPDKTQGRNRRPGETPLKIAARSLGLPIHQPAKFSNKSFYRILRDLAPDLFVTAACGFFLKPGHLKIPVYGTVNVHASLLPELRGGAPIHWAIARGHLKTGVTIMLTNEGLDTGPILSQHIVPILPSDTVTSLEPRLARAGSELLLKTIPLWLAGEITPKLQDESLATHAPCLAKSDARIDWTQPADQIECFIRGMNPWPGAYSFINNKRLKFILTRVNDSEEAMAVPGTITGCVRGEGFLVKTGDGMILATHVQPECKGPMRGDQLINGRFLKPGDIFQAEGAAH